MTEKAVGWRYLIVTGAAVEYIELRQFHVFFACASLAMFVARGALLFANRPIPRILRWLPHLNDTLLLAAAITLALWSGQYPLQQNWLTAKVCALLAYILLGKQALRAGLSWQKRLPWFCAALFAISYVFAVALSKNPLPFFSP